MNINEQWKNIAMQQDEDLSKLLSMPVIDKLPSKDPLQKIKRNLLINSIFGIVIGMLYVYLLIRFPFWQIIVCIGIVLVFTIWAVVKALQLYRHITTPVAGNSLLQEMERHYHNVSKWMKVQQWVGLFIYPISASGGFMLGGFLGSGKPIGLIMQKPVMIIALLICLAVLVPLCFYLAKWMNKVSFGDYASQLKQNIEQLKNG